MRTILEPTKTKANKQHQCNYCLGVIEKGESYERSVHIYDDLYTWKSHLKCSDIASKLKMFDYADEGVTHDYFYESIIEEYRQIMIKTNLELYESKEFKYPTFHEQLEFVINYYLTTPKP